MPQLVNYLRGAGAGAAIGSAISPGIGTAIGAGLGLVASFFDKDYDPEEERRRRRTELLAEIAKARTARLERGVKEIGQNTAGLMANVAADARRRAAAEGRSDVEALILPGQSNVAEAGSNALRGFQTDTQNYFDQAQLEVEQGWAGRPIQPGITDYLEELGVAALQYKSAQDRVSAMKDIYGVQSMAKPTMAPDPDGIQMSDYDVINRQLQPVQVRPYSAPMSSPFNPFSTRKSTNLVDAYRHAVGR